MLMTFFELLFLTKGNKAAIILFTPMTLVFKCSPKSFLFGDQSGKDYACGETEDTDISTIPFGVVFMIPALLIR